jgi:hypothetical protein
MVAGKLQTTVPDVFPDEFSKAGLVDRQVAGAKRHKPSFVHLDAGHSMTELGETGRRNQADVAGADNRKLRHYFDPPLPALPPSLPGFDPLDPPLFRSFGPPPPDPLDESPFVPFGPPLF